MQEKNFSLQPEALAGRRRHRVLLRLVKKPAGKRAKGPKRWNPRFGSPLLPLTFQRISRPAGCDPNRLKKVGENFLCRIFCEISLAGRS